MGMTLERIPENLRRFCGRVVNYVISSYLTANDCLEAINWLRWPVPVFSVYSEVFKQQYTSCMKVGTGGNLGLSREYH